MDKKLLVDDEISAKEVHLILPDGRSAGTVTNDQARYLAAQYDMELVLININSNPPIAKIVDVNKLKYQQEKQARLVKKTSQLKEMRLSFRISEHDLEIKANQARKFLADGHMVRVFTLLRGRENLFPDKAKVGLGKFVELTGSQWDQEPIQVGKRITGIIKPKK